MRLFIITLTLFLVIESVAVGQVKVKELEPFEKVIISPNIKATFVHSSENKVVVERADIDEEKVNITLEGKVLRIYLEGSRVFGDDNGEYKRKKNKSKKKSKYKGAVAEVTVNYDNIKSVSIRSGEDINFESSIDQDEFRLTAYGASTINIKELRLKDLGLTAYGSSRIKLEKSNIENQKLTLYGSTYVNFLSVNGKNSKVTSYGSSRLNLENGSIENQKFTLYGSTYVDFLGISGKTSKVTSFGSSVIKINVSDSLRVAAYGSSQILYKDSPDLSKISLSRAARVKKLKES